MEESLKFHIKVRVFHKERAFGPGVAELSEACRRMEMAYSKGWKITKRAEEDLGFPLMDGSRGGSHGGKTTLTEEGKEFLEKYEKFLEEVEESTKKSFEKYFLE